MLNTLPKYEQELLVFIGSFEAPKGYNTVYNNQMRKMPKPLTTMTFDEVVDNGPWRTKQFGSSACGRYQFMRDTLDKPGTLNDLKGQLKLSGSEIFTADLQDRLGSHLLRGRGIEKFIAGKLSVTQFALNLAKEWASFPVLADVKGQKRKVLRGQSYYAGDGKNKSLMEAQTLQDFLEGLYARHGRGPSPASPAPASIPAPLSPVATVEPAPRPASLNAGGILARLAALFTKPTVMSPTEADKALPGDPIVRMVQRELQARFYHTSKVDGWDGPETRNSVAAARKDNGLGDGGIDQEFLSKLNSFGPKPVSAERQNATPAQAVAIAKQQAPDLVAPLGTLWKAGAGLLGYVGIDTVATNNLITKAEQVTGQGNELLSTVQSALATISSVFSFIIEYRKPIIAVVALWMIWQAAKGFLNMIIRARRAFGL